MIKLLDIPSFLFNKKETLWKRILIGILLIVPWILATIFWFLLRRNNKSNAEPTDITTIAIDAKKEVVDKNIEKLEGKDIILKAKQDELTAKIRRIREKIVDADDRTTNIIKDIDAATSIGELNHIRDRIRRLDK